MYYFLDLKTLWSDETTFAPDGVTPITPVLSTGQDVDSFANGWVLAFLDRNEAMASDFGSGDFATVTFNNHTIYVPASGASISPTTYADLETSYGWTAPDNDFGGEINSDGSFVSAFEAIPDYILDISTLISSGDAVFDSSLGDYQSGYLIGYKSRDYAENFDAAINGNSTDAGLAVEVNIGGVSIWIPAGFDDVAPSTFYSTRESIDQDWRFNDGSFVTSKDDVVTPLPDVTIFNLDTLDVALDWDSAFAGVQPETGVLAAYDSYEEASRVHDGELVGFNVLYDGEVSYAAPTGGADTPAAGDETTTWYEYYVPVGDDGQILAGYAGPSLYEINKGFVENEQYAYGEGYTPGYQYLDSDRYTGFDDIVLQVNPYGTGAPADPDSDNVAPIVSISAESLYAAEYVADLSGLEEFYYFGPGDKLFSQAGNVDVIGFSQFYIDASFGPAGYTSINFEGDHSTSDTVYISSIGSDGSAAFDLGKNEGVLDVVNFESAYGAVYYVAEAPEDYVDGIDTQGWDYFDISDDFVGATGFVKNAEVFVGSNETDSGGFGDYFDFSLSDRDIYVGANAGDDEVLGGAGKDFIDGGAGIDDLDGGDGDDILLDFHNDYDQFDYGSRFGEDFYDAYMTGGTGKDTFVGDNVFIHDFQLSGQYLARDTNNLNDKIVFTVSASALSDFLGDAYFSVDGVFENGATYRELTNKLAIEYDYSTHETYSDEFLTKADGADVKLQYVTDGGPVTLAVASIKAYDDITGVVREFAVGEEKLKHTFLDQENLFDLKFPDLVIEQIIGAPVELVKGETYKYSDNVADFIQVQVGIEISDAYSVSLEAGDGVLFFVSSGGERGTTFQLWDGNEIVIGSMNSDRVVIQNTEELGGTGSDVIFDMDFGMFDGTEREDVIDMAKVAGLEDILNHSLTFSRVDLYGEGVESLKIANQAETIDVSVYRQFSDYFQFSRQETIALKDDMELDLGVTYRDKEDGSVWLATDSYSDALLIGADGAADNFEVWHAPMIKLDPLDSGLTQQVLIDGFDLGGTPDRIEINTFSDTEVSYTAGVLDDNGNTTVTASWDGEFADIDFVFLGLAVSDGDLASIFEVQVAAL